MVEKPTEPLSKIGVKFTSKLGDPAPDAKAKPLPPKPRPPPGEEATGPIHKKGIAMGKTKHLGLEAIPEATEVLPGPEGHKPPTLTEEVPPGGVGMGEMGGMGGRGGSVPAPTQEIPRQGVGMGEDKTVAIQKVGVKIPQEEEKTPTVVSQPIYPGGSQSTVIIPNRGVKMAAPIVNYNTPINPFQSGIHPEDDLILEYMQKVDFAEGETGDMVKDIEIKKIYIGNTYTREKPFTIGKDPSNSVSLKHVYLLDELQFKIFYDQDEEEFLITCCSIAMPTRFKLMKDQKLVLSKGSIVSVAFEFGMIVTEIYGNTKDTLPDNTLRMKDLELDPEGGLDALPGDPKIKLYFQEAMPECKCYGQLADREKVITKKAVFGRHVQRCKPRFIAPYVSRQHAQIAHDKDLGWILKECTYMDDIQEEVHYPPAGTYLLLRNHNDLLKKQSREIMLKNGCSLVIGPYIFSIRVPK